MTVQDQEFRRALGAAQAGDVTAFTELWRRTGPRLDRYLTIVAGAHAADAAVASWAVVAAGLRSFAGDERAFRGVLARIGRAEALSRRRLEPPGAPQPTGIPGAGPPGPQLGPLAVLT